MKLSFILLGFTLLVFTVSGCAYQEVLRSQILEFENTIPTCSSDEECEIKCEHCKLLCPCKKQHGLSAYEEYLVIHFKMEES